MRGCAGPLRTSGRNLKQEIGGSRHLAGICHHRRKHLAHVVTKTADQLLEPPPPHHEARSARRGRLLEFLTFDRVFFQHGKRMCHGSDFVAPVECRNRRVEPAR